jgi:hypothetical protein
MRVLLVLSLALLTSCGLSSRGQLRGGVYESSDVRYRIKSPEGDWRRVSVASADVAWIHDELGASLLVNSHCRGVQDAPLEALAGHLLIGFTERALLAERKLELSRREALEREVQAKLDGVPRPRVAEEALVGGLEGAPRGRPGTRANGLRPRRVRN